MEGIRNKVEQSGAAVKPKTRGIYETFKSGALKTWHGSPHYGAKGGRNKGKGYTSEYAQGTDHNKTD